MTKAIEVQLYIQTPYRWIGVFLSYIHTYISAFFFFKYLTTFIKDCFLRSLNHADTR